MMKRVVIIGGGAAGFFAAINIKECRKDIEVIVLEKTKQYLSKVKVSGGGRCNVTHACFVPQDLIENYPRGKKELRGPFNSFGPGELIEWFSKRGVELKIEEDGRMFPVSNSSSTIVDCFMEQAKSLGIQLKDNSKVIGIKKQDEGFVMSLDSGLTISSDYLIVAAGGNSKLSHYGYLADLGHKIVSPIPSLFTFNLPKHPSNQLMGVSSFGEVKILGSNYSQFGPILFTHWGFSGPAIIKLSSKAARFLYEKNYQFEFSIRWIEEAKAEIDLKRKEQGGKAILNSIPDGLPKRIWVYLLEKYAIAKDLNWADLNRMQLLDIENSLSNDVYTANGKTSFKEEFVTCGGVKLSEIEMKSMESKIISGLYFSGEVIDVDALTGGFNFQAAWTTAWLTAQHICEKA